MERERRMPQLAGFPPGFMFSLPSSYSLRGLNFFSFSVKGRLGEGEGAAKPSSHGNVLRVPTAALAQSVNENLTSPIHRITGIEQPPCPPDPLAHGLAAGRCCRTSAGLFLFFSVIPRPDSTRSLAAQAVVLRLTFCLTPRAVGNLNRSAYFLYQSLSLSFCLFLSLSFFLSFPRGMYPRSTRSVFPGGK